MKLRLQGVQYVCELRQFDKTKIRIEKISFRDILILPRARSLMDKMPASEAGDYRFDSCRAHNNRIFGRKPDFLSRGG